MSSAIDVTRQLEDFPRTRASTHAPVDPRDPTKACEPSRASSRVVHGRVSVTLSSAKSFKNDCKVKGFSQKTTNTSEKSKISARILQTPMQHQRLQPKSFQKVCNLKFQLESLPNSRPNVIQEVRLWSVGLPLVAQEVSNSTFACGPAAPLRDKYARNH